MSKLAIKGHKERGEEVIKILEMLGGKNSNCSGKNIYAIYSIPNNVPNNGYIYPYQYAHQKYPDDFIIFTLEEFLQEFPYKVGDKVQHKGATSCGTVYVTERMEWANNRIEYEIRPLYDYNHTGLVTVCADELQPYKEETMEETDIIDHTTEINLNHPCFGKCNEIELIIPDGWEFQRRGNKMFGVRKQYPKTYEECCEVLNIISNNELVFSNPNEESEYAYRNKSLYNTLDRLKICRDAYWKIAGEQMGLGKPWEPDYNEESYEQGSPIKYVIYYTGTYITKGQKCTPSCILAFPTEEMRDYFYENFKELINETKELL